MAEDWINKLPPQERARASELLERMKGFDAPDAEDWVRSELTEDIPQMARFLLLRLLTGDIEDWLILRDLWVKNQIDEADKHPQGYFAEAGRALKRMQEAGVSTDDIGYVAQWVAFSATFQSLRFIEEGNNTHAADLPNWALVEVNAEEQLTGRVLGTLYEDLLTMLDPKGLGDNAGE